jgi:hypothetical protein
MEKDPADMENGWGEWSRHVLSELKRMNDQYEQIVIAIGKDKEAMDKELREIYVQLAVLQVKSGIWGIVGGIFSALLIIAIQILYAGKN